ncbi:hypothetical protein RchiOBHm_Chr6g0303181 [Rosa chinensis]|uniref:Uncharacterized protein n=1 Tax=Rosa chinensis TaxID=74649 RepID=A0A2P6PZ72_ROSCH|nr:uncharacterized protein LOC112171874 [Rosa chinensis]PRQ27235.1 hypothetical protein RchiOBHm_Chr6g0303181 [Rosa chinensis]
MAMEAVALDRSMSSCKQIRMMMARRSFSSSENVAPSMNFHGGLLQAPHAHPPPSFSSFNPSLFNHYMQQQFLQPQQQPPLLPLPVSKPLHQSLPSRTRSLSRPPTARKTNNARSQSLTPKKPKSKQSKKEDINSMPADCFIIASTTRLGPDPNDLPKDVTKVLSSSSGKTTLIGSVGVGEHKDNFSSSIFTLAPPPSSLPLPRFSLKPPRRCKAEAVGVDAGATDNLCRLLRLR